MLSYYAPFGMCVVCPNLDYTEVHAKYIRMQCIAEVDRDNLSNGSVKYSRHIMYVRIRTRERAMRYIHTWLADGYTGSWLYSNGYG